MAVVAIVSHNEKMALGDFYRSEIDFGGVMGQLPMGGFEDAIFVIIKILVYVDFSVNHLKYFAWEADNTFNKIFALILGVNKYDYIVALGSTDRDNGFVYKREFNPIDEFVDKDVVANQQGGNHRP